MISHLYETGCQANVQEVQRAVNYCYRHCLLMHVTSGGQAILHK